MSHLQHVVRDTPRIVNDDVINPDVEMELEPLVDPLGVHFGVHGGGAEHDMVLVGRGGIQTQRKRIRFFMINQMRFVVDGHCDLPPLASVGWMTQLAIQNEGFVGKEVMLTGV